MVATPSDFLEFLVEKCNYLLKKFVWDYHYRTEFGKHMLYLYIISAQKSVSHCACVVYG